MYAMIQQITILACWQPRVNNSTLPNCPSYPKYTKKGSNTGYNQRSVDTYLKSHQLSVCQ